MTTNIVIVLARIAQKPGATPSTSLITTRRICRIFTERLDSIGSERQAMRRQAGKLRQHLPFTAGSMADLQRRALEHRSQECEDLRTVMIAFGRSLLMDTEGLTQALGFDRICDLLSVNPAQRHQACADGDTGIRGIVFISRLEDSADLKREAWGDCSPLYRACQLATMKFIQECPEHLLPDPFAPGAPFGPKLPPTLTIVGA